MVTPKISRAIVLIGVLLSQLAAAETALSPAYFSHTASISFNDPKALVVSSHLPQWSYLASKQQLTDLRVFNAEGIAVAHQLSTLQETKPGSEFSVDAIAIPVDADVNEFAGHVTDINLDGKGKVAIHMSEFPQSASTTKLSKIAQWILDDPKLSSTPVDNIRFELNENQQAGFEANVAIEISEDLRRWQAVVSNQKLLVYYGGHRLSQLTIALPAVQSRYWRIRSSDADLSRIIKIVVRSPAKASVVTEKLTTDCLLNQTKERVICPLGGRLPITSVQFDFGSQRVAFNALIKTYEQVPEPEKSKTEPVSSEILNAMMISSDTAAIRLQGLPISQVEMMMPQGGQLGLLSAPRVTVQWPAQQLSFLAHGSAPFTLAVGADQPVKRSEQFIDSGLATTSGSIAEPVIQEPKAFPVLLKKRPWLLWGLLAAGVLALGWMAISLLKEK